jgi:Zn-dependent metalloprotease
MTLLVQACAQLGEVPTTQLLRKTSLELSQAQFEMVDEKLSDGSRLILIQKETSEPRLIERDLTQVAHFSNRNHLSKDDLLWMAKGVLDERYPKIHFELKHIRNGFAFSYVTFEQWHLNRPLFGAEITLRMTSAGDWASLTSSLHPVDQLPKQESTTSAERVKKSLGFLSPTAMILKQRSVIYPRKENDSFRYHFAQELQISDSLNRTGFVIWVDESTGEILGEFNPEQHAVKKIGGTIVPNSIKDSWIWQPLQDVQILSRGQKLFFDRSGSFDFSQLRGERLEVRLANDFLEVVNNGGPDNGASIVVDDEFLAGGMRLDFDQFSSIEERNIYYWIMKARDHLVNELDFHEMNYPIVAMARDGIKLDNAYFNPLFKMLGKPVLGFGIGSTFLKNTALSRDIILHEYGHAITFEIYGMKANYEFSAMNEAFSDYFAATITDDPLIAEDMFVDPNRRYLRRVDSQMRFPNDFNGRYFHNDGQMFSGALWQLRNRLGAPLADRMIHEARLSQASSIVEFYAALMKIDEAFDDQNEWTPSPNKRAIRESFRHHGLNSQTRFVAAQVEDLTSFSANCWAN